MSEREQAVLAQAADGFGNAEIGGRLFLSEGVVKAYMSAAYRKLGARDRAHAVALGFRAGWLR